jgi:GrpB-like predicted nucleotidyltransferase (UPF0157 family)
VNELPRDTVLGLAYGMVRLVGSDPGWPGAFHRLAAELSQALGQHAMAIEHVGSTAVPGLAAKPILDVAVGLSPDADPAQVVAILEPLGWIFRGDKGDAGLLLVLEAHPSHRVAHLHVVGFGDARWHRYLAFRDRLRADATARAAYAELKCDLAERLAGDRAAYTAAKHTFIAGLLAQP